MSRRIRLPVSLVATLCIAGMACSRANVPPKGFTTRDSAGVTIAENNGGAWAPDSGWKIGPVDLALGGDTSPGPKLGDVGHVALMSDGRVVVTDAGNDAVIVYDPAARAGRTIAKEGHGPGEVFRVVDAWVGPADSIVAYDGGNARLEIFAPDGRFVRTMLLATSGPDVGMTAVGRLPDGTFLGDHLHPPAKASVQARWDSASYLRLGADSLNILDTLVVLPRFEQFMMHVTYLGRAMPPTPQPIVYGHMTDVLTTPGGFAVANNAHWQIQEYDARGRLRRSIRRMVTPERVTSADIDAYRRVYDSALQNQKGLPPELRAQFASQVRGAPASKTVPLFGRVLCGADGSYWVGRYDPLEQYTFESYSVIDSTGRYLGEIAIPKGEHLVAVTGTEIYTVGTTPTGGPVLLRRPIVR
ncbi:MAG TPA: hypothetical protein VJ992_09840 [Gemmatimonadales bacterium]|nr:hypothetical protein [Gemmatimonadales bacterium]